MPATNRTSHSSDFRLPSAGVPKPPSDPPLCLSNFLMRSIEREALGRAARPVVAQHAQAGLDLGEQRAAGGVRDGARVREEALDVEDVRQRRPLLRLLADEQRRSGAAIGMAPALHGAPVGARAVHQVGDVGDRARRRQRKPVAQRIGRAGLPLHVFRQVRERIAMPRARLVVDLFVAAGERHRLEGDEADLVAVLDREPDDPADLVVVDRLARS